jgi:iron-sulfur cluster repair protein YtfE (RIC family)
MREPGPTGEMARNVMQVMDGHMMREEKFALRPLGLLKALSRGETPAEVAEAARAVEGLREQMPQMIDEHRQIAELLREFAREAEAAGKAEYVVLATELIQHAHLEEDVLYPAALLVGRFAEFVRSS